jgi:hypothetical protein
MGGLFSKTEDVELVFTARKPIPGFKKTAELKVIAHGGETYGDVLERFNTFRGPDSQIPRLLNEAGDSIDLQDRVVANRHVFVN